MSKPDSDGIPPFRPTPAISPAPPVKPDARSDYTLVVVIVAASLFLLALMMVAGLLFFRVKTAQQFREVELQLRASQERAMAGEGEDEWDTQLETIEFTEQAQVGEAAEALLKSIEALDDTAPEAVEAANAAAEGVSDGILLRENPED